MAKMIHKFWEHTEINILNKCLYVSGGILQLKHDKTCWVVVACATLHNIAPTLQLADPENMDDDDNAGEEAGEAGEVAEAGEVPERGGIDM